MGACRKGVKHLWGALESETGHLKKKPGKEWGRETYVQKAWG